MDYVAKLINYTQTQKLFLLGEGCEILQDANGSIVTNLDDAKDLLSASDYTTIVWTPLGIGSPPPRKRNT